MTDLQKLKAFARAATPGPWEADHRGVFTSDPTVGILNRVCHVTGTTGYAETEQENAKFIAAANPVVILELIERLEKAEATQLRDHFAGLAIQGLISSSNIDIGRTTYKTLANDAYNYADAMLAAREKSP